MEKKLVTDLIEILETHNLNFSLAESCSGGLLSSWITAEPGVSKFFFGAVVSYVNSAKENILGVHHESLQSAGAVSEVVVREMARGARDIFKSSWSVAITGVAGPSGGSIETPVGSVWIGVCGPYVERAVPFLFSGERNEIQRSSARAALELLIQTIASHAKDSTTGNKKVN